MTDELKECPFEIIKSKQGDEILVDREDKERLSKYLWSVYDRYAETNINGHTIKMHRFIMDIHDIDIHIDHINHNPLDNRKVNLRLCNRFQNQQNRLQTNNPYGAKGIQKLPSGHFRVRVQAFGKRVEVGVYSTIEEAKNARQNAAKIMHGNFYN